LDGHGKEQFRKFSRHTVSRKQIGIPVVGLDSGVAATLGEVSADAGRDVATDDAQRDAKDAGESQGTKDFTAALDDAAGGDWAARFSSIARCHAA
jgi:hypothetical protein